MSGRMKKHHTKNDPAIYSLSNEEDSVSLDAFLKKNRCDLPNWAILLSGLRNREGWTQKELGEMVNVAQYHISRMERGVRPIGKNVAQRLAKVFKTDYRLFL